MLTSDESKDYIPNLSPSRESQYHVLSACHNDGLDLSTLFISTGFSGGVWMLIFTLLNFNHLALLSAAFTFFVLLMISISLAFNTKRFCVGLQSRG